MAKPSPTLRSQWLGQQLRLLREEAGLTLKEVGQYVQRDPSSVSRMEAGVHPARLPDVLAYLDIAGVEDPTRREELKQMGRDIWQKGWWTGYAEDVAASLIDRVWLENRARAIRSYHLVIPGLLQTHDYAEAVIRAEDPDASDALVARFLEVRMRRQQILDREDPLGLHVVLDEMALRRPSSSQEILRDQLGHLIEVVGQANVEIRVLPVDAESHPGLRGPFELFEMPEPYTEVGYVEGQAGEIFVEGAKADRLRRKYDGLCAFALDRDASAALITKAAEDLE
ncbi:MAG: helix-turn-helix domain-containing protein [Micromonosporaceae bacterium]|nr:helix-turn-helix domain-containing protein [Micromonosporaceae bacterium]